MPRFDLIAFDADDTLWHNERLYENTQAALAKLLAGYGVSAASLEAGLYQTETRNIGLFGYGIKSFTLSMIETAVQMTWGHLSGYDVLAILDLARAQLKAPVELLEHAREAVSQLAARYRLMVITKGELHDQETKLRRSGLGGLFPGYRRGQRQDPESYATLFKNHCARPGPPGHGGQLAALRHPAGAGAGRARPCMSRMPAPGSTRPPKRPLPARRASTRSSTSASCRPCSKPWNPTTKLREFSLGIKKQADGGCPSAVNHLLLSRGEKKGGSATPSRGARPARTQVLVRGPERWLPCLSSY